MGVSENINLLNLIIHHFPYNMVHTFWRTLYIMEFIVTTKNQRAPPRFIKLKQSKQGIERLKILFTVNEIIFCEC